MGAPSARGVHPGDEVNAGMGAPGARGVHPGDGG